MDDGFLRPTRGMRNEKRPTIRPRHEIETTIFPGGLLGVAVTVVGQFLSAQAVLFVTRGEEDSRALGGLAIRLQHDTERPEPFLETDDEVGGRDVRWRRFLRQ